MDPVPEKPSILVVDDDRLVLAALVRSLDQRFQVIAAVSGEDALTVLQNTTIDVVVTDLDMPGGMNGAVLLDTVRKTAPKTRRVLLSAKPEECEHAELVLAKPWPPDLPRLLLGLINA